MEYNANGQFTYNGEIYDFNFKKDLTIVEKINFIKGVCDWVLDDARYFPILEPYAFKYHLFLLTDIDTNLICDEDGNVSLEKFLEFADETMFEYNILNAMDEVLIQELKDNISVNLAYKSGIHRDKISEELAKLILDVRKNLDKVFNENILNPELVNKLTDLAKNSQLNTKSLVDTYLKTDTHKNNISKVNKPKNNKSTKKKVVPEI